MPHGCSKFMLFQYPCTLAETIKHSSNFQIFEAGWTIIGLMVPMYTSRCFPHSQMSRNMHWVPYTDFSKEKNTWSKRIEEK